ncbi:hypothetical protein OIDMADRAFT_23693 [Oidiodendron maius Zn]|uniref:Uncharacterized protein n=1 Tax=Oidiodendron maius (strain Zn) TaxID=913774 RepID=A0A0C3HL49_OIDMZ|nr:hypothetical protein OIDMADRAFT_23693 [Oidiodendron maius Zn]
MKFNIGMLVALVATTQLAAAAPVPAWNGKNAEAAYKCGTVAAGVAYAACRNAGLPGAANAAVGVGLAAAGAEAAVKVSQSPAGQAAGQKIAAGASAVKCAAGKACSAAGQAISSAASSVGQAGSKLVQSVTGGGQRQSDVEMGHRRREAQPEYEYRQLDTRELEPEPEFEHLEAREPAFELETRDEAAPLYTRYAEPEPEPSWDNLY